MSETDLWRSIVHRFSRGAMRIFRNSVGGAWQALPRDTIRHADGSVTLRNARFIKYGLCEGSHDLIGFRQITITEAHVGLTIAQFVSIETKSPKGSPTTEQLAFLRTVNQAGGIAAIVKSEEQAERLLTADLGSAPCLGTSAATTTQVDIHDSNAARAARPPKTNRAKRMAGTVPGSRGQTPKPTD